MPRDIPHTDWRQTSLLSHIAPTWREPLVRLALAWAAIFVLTARDWLTMFDQWWNVSTYNHVLFVPFIVGWLVWVRRAALKEMTPQAWWPGLIMLGGALFLWLLGSLAGINTASQLGAVVALQACVLTLLGPRMAAALLFPLGFMLFLVPFGDEMVPALQMITAKLVIELTHWSGIPAVIEGVFIDTPVGLFEVAEACSGVKFLVAMMALGTLVAHTCFLSWKRRVLFLLAAISLPILANGVRAWATIYIAQSQGLEFAIGFDHIFYGWVFFALVVAALLAGAWRWFDRDPDDLTPDVAEIEASPLLARLSAMRISANAAAIGALGLVLVFVLWGTIASRMQAPVRMNVSLPHVENWQLVESAPTVPWEPRASGADHRLLGRYVSAEGDEVDVFFALYSAQGAGREASAFGEGALIPDTPWRWLESGASTAAAQADYILAYGNTKRLAETSYRTGNLLTGSSVRLKLATMVDRLFLRQKPTMLMIVSAENPDNDAAMQSIAKFRNAIGNEGEWMDRIAGLR